MSFINHQQLKVFQFVEWSGLGLEERRVPEGRALGGEGGGALLPLPALLRRLLSVDREEKQHVFSTHLHRPVTVLFLTLDLVLKS